MQELNEKFKTFIINESDILIEKLSSYIYNYIKDDKYINQFFIEKIIGNIINIRKLNNYLKDIIIDNNNPLIYAEYNYFENENNIIINIENIINIINNKYNFLNIEERKMLILYEIIEICFHETEHASQVKVCNEFNLDLESYILKISTIYKRNKEDIEKEIINKGYCNFKDIKSFVNNQLDVVSDEKLYYFKPEERLAEVKANIITLNIFLNIFKDISYLEKISINSIYQTILYGYDRYKMPFKEYMVKFNPFISFNEILDKTSNLNYLEKAVYGLEISNKEIDLINKSKIKILSKK